MDKKFIEERKKQLEKKKEEIRAQLKTFAKQTNKKKEEWKTLYPVFGEGQADEEEDEVEEFDTLVALKEVLENELERIDKALTKIKKGKYGICERSGKPISKERLKIIPQARYCAKCQAIVNKENSIKNK